MRVAGPLLLPAAATKAVGLWRPSWRTAPFGDPPRRARVYLFWLCGTLTVVDLEVEFPEASVQVTVMV